MTKREGNREKERESDKERERIRVGKPHKKREEVGNNNSTKK